MHAFKFLIVYRSFIEVDNSWKNNSLNDTYQTEDADSHEGFPVGEKRSNQSSNPDGKQEDGDCENSNKSYAPWIIWAAT